MRYACTLGLFVSLIITEAKTPYWKQMSTDYERPVALEQLPSGDFLILEQEGKIYLTDFKKKKGLVLDWSKRVTRKGNEQGLLGIALDPKFSSNGRYYLNLNNKKNATEIWRVTVDPKNISQLRTEPENILFFDQPYRNHNGGWLGFGPDGYLYIGTGDGGSSNDPKNAAQDLSSLLGKILRIDVSGQTSYRIPKSNPKFPDQTARPEIYAYGLRNPWRCDWHSDRFYIADVGQNAWEEVNIVSRSQLKGANFGWRLREGSIATPKKKIGGDAPKPSIEPVYVYPHNNEENGGFSITGGILYHGSIDSLKGRYFFADYVSTKIWSMKERKGKVSQLRHHHKEIFPDKGAVQSIASFGEDRAGELYILCFNGSIFQLAQK